MAENSFLLGAPSPSTKDEVNIKDLPELSDLSASDSLIVIQNDAYTKKVIFDDVTSYILKDATIPTLTTNNKNIIGAINEVAGVEIIGTLPAFTRTLVLRNPNIKATSEVRVLTEDYTIAPTNVVATPGTVVLSFEPRELAIKVKVRIS